MLPREQTIARSSGRVGFRSPQRASDPALNFLARRATWPMTPAHINRPLKSIGSEPSSCVPQSRPCARPRGGVTSSISRTNAKNSPTAWNGVVEDYCLALMPNATIPLSGYASPNSYTGETGLGRFASRLPPGAGAIVGDRMNGQSKLASFECATCSAWIEVYPQDEPGEPSIGWNAQDEALCKSPPIRRCPHLRAEISVRHPGFDE